jgi:plasmid stabilization system protein ParE
VTALFSATARYDLFDIAAYIAHDSITRAERYDDALEAAVPSPRRDALNGRIAA